MVLIALRCWLLVAGCASFGYNLGYPLVIRFYTKILLDLLTSSPFRKARWTPKSATSMTYHVSGVRAGDLMRTCGVLKNLTKILLTILWVS